ncbi:MAG: hypothetical protein OXH52_17525 [Gammaproteobacteria bacterium]|nr:hypothetical protein [Gammaproteobacteria bacterium]
MLMTAPRSLLVIGAVLAGFFVVSQGVLLFHVMETNELLNTIFGAQRAMIERVAAGDYEEPQGVTTSAHIQAGPIETTTPAGEALTGMWELNMQTQQLVVISSDRNLGRRIEDVDTREFIWEGGMFERPPELLLDLHGWPRERWPEGWTP